MRTYTVYAAPTRDEFDYDYTAAVESVTYEEETTHDGRTVGAYTFVARADRVERLERLLSTDTAVVAWGRDPTA